MKGLIRELKNYKFSVLLIVFFLFIQAYTTLTLPDYMARIINVGIQQGGIETAPPEVLSRKTLDRMKLVSSDTDAKLMDMAYKTGTDKELSDLKKQSGFNSVTSEGLLYLQNDYKDNKELLTAVSKALMTVRVLNEGMPSKMGGSGSLGALGNLPKGDAAFEMIKALPAAQKEAMLTQINKVFSNLPSQMTEQGAMSLVASEYGAIGADAEKIQTAYIISAGAKMLGISLIALAASLIVGFISSRVAADMGLNLRNRFFDRVMSFSSQEFTKFSTASLITRNNNDIQQVQNMLVMMLRIVFYAPIMAIGGIIKVLNTDLSMAWIIALAVVVILSFVGLMFYFAMPQFQKVQKLVDRLSLVTREILNGIPVIRAFVAEKHEEKRFEAANQDLKTTNQKVANIMILMNPMLMLIMNGVTILIIWVGANRIDAGTIRVGDMMAFMQYAMQILMSFLMITMVSIMMPRAQISLGRVTEVLDTEATIKDPEKPVVLPEKIKGEIEFRNVSFRFHDAPEDVIKNVNLKINAGETVAFIGSTGSGKSTLINLVPRFHDVTEGEILIDGINIKDMGIRDLRKHIGYVPQTANLFTGTIDTNMHIGKNQDITDEMTRRAIKAAQADEFVDKLEEGINHEVVQGGTNLSGGQKQRLSIARAIAADPEIFIFDDSFSALDFKTDLELRKALRNEYGDSTILIVAQRIGTIMKADKIVVLDEGRITDVGTHEYLMEHSEIYEKIASSQIRKEEA